MACFANALLTYAAACIPRGFVALFPDGFSPPLRYCQVFQGDGNEKSYAI